MTSSVIWNILYGIIIAVIGAGGAWVLGLTGVLNAQAAKRKDATDTEFKREDAARDAQKIIVDEAMAIVGTLSAQLKDVRAESVANELHQAQEIQALRGQLRVVETRLSDSEARLAAVVLENAHLKAKIYDLQHPADPRRRQRSAGQKPFINGEIPEEP